MTAPLEMLVPAAGVSLLALACLALLPRAPAEVRFWIAVAGLAPWAVPWPLLKWTLPLPVAETWRALPTLGVGAALGDLPLVQNVAGNPSPTVVPWLVVAAFAIGAAWLAADCVRMRTITRSWRTRSTNADTLRELLPARFRATNVEIRIVRDSPYAAASGYVRPTIWIGDELRDRGTIRVALLHECWHVRRRDPLKVLLLTALRRAYWWNPLVRALAKQAALLLEAACDRRCAREIGRELYVAELARTMLAASNPPPLPIAAAAGTRGSNLLRLDLLNRETVMRARDHVVLWAFAASVLVLAACQTVEPGTSATTVEILDAGAPNPGVQLIANYVKVYSESGVTEFGGDVRMKTTAEHIVVIKTDRSSAERDSITLAGNVLLAIDGSDVEADEITIRALDGRPLDLQAANRAEIEGRQVELTTRHARMSSAYR
ncbi:MAG TPA: M56 family metallopeptidase [Gammaproteobacteria bacterium]|nr:M56 family metallopeptidase [Gammaproteobacteria bacterium]